MQTSYKFKKLSFTVKIDYTDPKKQKKKTYAQHPLKNQNRKQIVYPSFINQAQQY